jgi:hypothetical protein
MKASDWINVKYRQPKLNETVLVCREDEYGELYVDAATYIEDNYFLTEIKVWITRKCFDKEDVTHWQPIVLP